MSPDEMREAAKRLRARVFVMERLGETADDERAGADALDRLADVIEHLERASLVYRVGIMRPAWLDSMLRISRGEQVT